MNDTVAPAADLAEHFCESVGRNRNGTARDRHLRRVHGVAVHRPADLRVVQTHGRALEVRAFEDEHPVGIRPARAAEKCKLKFKKT